MSADALLQRLEKVQRAGKGWRAVCPSCGGRSRKLSVVENDDGRTLVHCFGGCEALVVVQAVGLDLVDLFPERLPDDKPGDRQQRRRSARESQWGAALEMLDLEARVVQIAYADMSAGRALSAEDLTRLAQACQRIAEARTVLRDCKAWRPNEVKA